MPYASSINLTLAAPVGAAVRGVVGKVAVVVLVSVLVVVSKHLSP